MTRFVCVFGKTKKSNYEIQGSLHCGGKSAAFGGDDVGFGWGEKDKAVVGSSIGLVTMRPLAASLRVVRFVECLGRTGRGNG
jgi:hypothetical protein